MMHTPGPWHCTGTVVWRPVQVSDDEWEQEKVADTGSEANAHLIASAPELLGALDAVANAYVYIGGIDAEIIEQVEEAIEKAKGKTNEPT